MTVGGDRVPREIGLVVAAIVATILPVSARGAVPPPSTASELGRTPYLVERGSEAAIAR